MFNGLVRTIRAALSFDGNNPKDPNLAKLFGLAGTTHSGVSVEVDTVLGMPAVFRGVNIIANGLSKVPFSVLKTDDMWETQGWDREHPSWECVTRKVNDNLCDGEFRRTMTAWALLYGNAVAKIERPNWPNRGPVRLFPLLPDRTKPFLLTEDRIKDYNLNDDLDPGIYYETHVGQETLSFHASECIHIKGLGPNPYWGYNVIEMLREAFGGAIAGAEFGQRYWGQGANPAGIVTIPHGLAEEEEENLITSLKRGSEGLGRSHRFMILEEGAEFKPMTVDPADAQFIEGREFDIRTLAMAIGIKVHKLIDSANTSFSSLEQANQEHKEDDLMPWIDRWREELSTKLLTERQQQEETHRIDVDQEYLEWAPFSERASGVVELYNNGLVTKEEGRRRLSFGKSASIDGSRFRMPSNIIFEDMADTYIAPGAGVANQNPPEDQEDPEPPQDPPVPENDSEGDEAIAEMIQFHLLNVGTRLGKQGVRAAKKSPGAFIAWVDGLEGEEAPVMVQDSVDQVYGNLRGRMNAVADTATADELVTAVESEVDTFLKELGENDVAS